MVDPLTALGIASNIVQLVDFTSKILKKTSQLRFDAETIDNARLEALTSDLASLSENLQVPRLFSEDSPNKSSEDEKGLMASAPSTLANRNQAILEIARGSIAIANELIACLERIKFKLHEERSVWASIRKAVIAISSKERVKEIAALLDTYRNELALRTLVLLSANVGKHANNHEKRFERLEHKENDIIEAILISQKFNTHQADAQTRLHEKPWERPREVTAAILTHRDGRITTLTLPNTQPTILEDNFSGERLSKDIMTLRALSSNSSSRIGGTATIEDFELVQRRVLRTLSFTKIRDRMDKVQPPFHSTFEWIFEVAEKSDLPWANLLQWLEDGRGCYWINGKAGSGKSTLMKHIYNSPKTTNDLTLWAGRSHLIVASYFSWNLGAALQKTHVGLLRSLHDILDQVPGFIPTVLPKLLRKSYWKLEVLVKGMIIINLDISAE